jgi:signal transduction histidine kinase
MMPDPASVEVSRHKCLIYDGDPSEQLPVVVPLLLDALQENWRCLYLGSPPMVDMTASALSARGVDTREVTRRGALLLSSDRSHLEGGSFEPAKMIDGLCRLIDGAVNEGFRGLCATGDMRWELGDDDGSFDRLLEYEAELEKVFRDRPLKGICQYHRDLVPAQAVRDALLTHRSAWVGDVLNRDNLFYVPPELLLERSGATAAAQGEWMCQQILRVLEAERARDKALVALTQSETRQRRLAEELALLNRDLERRVAERTAELELANKNLESFTYSVSHDLRAPLRAVTGFSEILAREFHDVLGERGRHQARRIAAGARQMNALIDGLLTLSRVGRADLNRVAIDLTALAEAIVRELQDAEPQRSVDVRVERGLRAMGDPVLLRAALTNLIGNAWKFTGKNAEARIEIGRAEDGGGDAVFFVRDNGAGFAMEQAPKLFGVFQRLHTQEEFPGTGVGLATVEKIVARHGGRIWAEARPDQGATFSFTLPSRS